MSVGLTLIKNDRTSITVTPVTETLKLDNGGLSVNFCGKIVKLKVVCGNI